MTAGSPTSRAAGISWQRNLYSLVAISFLMFAAFGFVLPFLPLFIAQLGNFDLNQVEVLSGVSGFGQAMVLAIVAPIWGAFADRHGRRLMVLRASFGGGAVIGLMGLSPNFGVFFVLRLAQGLMTGVSAAVIALAVAFVPRQRVGYALGLVQMAVFAGNAVGPLLGGFIADRTGYRVSFAFSAGLFILAGVLVMVFVKEEFVPPAPGQSQPGLSGLLQNIRERGADKQLLVMMLVLFSAQFGVNVVQPMLPLFVAAIDPAVQVATITGIVFTVAGVVAAVFSVIWGRVGDRIGSRRLLILAALGAGTIYVPMGLVRTAVQLIVLRGVLGIFDGGLVPSANAVIAASMQDSGDKQSTEGTTYGLVQLANGLGFALGPLSGGFIAAAFGLRSVFFVTAAILLLIGVYLPFGIKDPSRKAAGA